MASCKWNGLDAVNHRLIAYADGLKAEALLAAQEIAAYLEAYAITHHPWQVQTGATNVTTKGTVVADLPGLVTIVLSAGMDYDRLLETAHDGTWAWIYPALLANENEIRTSLKRHLSNLRA